MNVQGQKSWDATGIKQRAERKKKKTRAKQVQNCSSRGKPMSQEYKVGMSNTIW